MTPTDKQKYDLEIFNGLYPLIWKLLNSLNLTNETTEYVVNGVVFDVRKVGDVVEMGLPIESPIFPTLSFRQFDDGNYELLHYRIGKEFKDSLFKATEMYVRGKEKVSLIFKKELNATDSNGISYETVMPSFMTKHKSSNITLEVDGLSNQRLSEYWDKQQLNANNLFANKSAKIVIFYGNVFEGGNSSSMQLSEDGVFITWCVDSVEYLTSIAYSLKNNVELSVKIDLDEDDFYFAEAKQLYNAELTKISITFS